MALYLYRKLFKNHQEKEAKEQTPCHHEITTAPDILLVHGQRSDKTTTTQSPPLPTSQQPRKTQSCVQCIAEKTIARKYRWKLVVGLLLPYLLASLDLTVVATSLPFIASHFNKFNQLNWIVTSYTLTSTAFIPAYGQIADVFGRHSTLQISMTFMVIGSTLCAAAQTWGMLLFGRALQGLSAAGIMNIIKIILSDKVSLQENAKNNTIFALVAGSSYSIGPVIGGYLTNSNWRYCFVLSIPIALASQLLIFFLLRKELVGGTYRIRDGFPSFLAGIATIDIGGTTIFVFGVGLIILATTWGGATYSWGSAAVLAPLIIGSVLFVLFWVYEYFLEPGRIISRIFPRQDAMIPWALFKKRDTLILAAISFATGAAMYSVFYFIGIYWTLVEAYPAGKAGVQLLYYIPGIGVGVYLAMFWCNVWPRMTFPPLFFGTVVETAGVAMLTWAVTTRKVALVDGMMALAGAGTGMRFMPNTLHAAGVWPDRIAPTMSVMDFVLPFGGTLALAIMGSVFNNKMAGVFLGGGASQGFNVHNTESLNSIATLPQDQQDAIRNTAKKAVMLAFISITPLMGLSVLAAAFLGNVWIGKSKGETESYVLHSPYLFGLFKRTAKSDREVTRPASGVGKQTQAGEARRRRLNKTEEKIGGASAV